MIWTLQDKKVKVTHKHLCKKFLDAFSHLYKRVCPSVGWSVRPSVTLELKLCKSAVFDQNYYQYE